MNNKRGPTGNERASVETVRESIPYAKTNVTMGTNVHSGFTRQMTAAAATLRTTTPRAAEYRARYCEPDLVPESECGTMSDLQCL